MAVTYEPVPAWSVTTALTNVSAASHTRRWTIPLATVVATGLLLISTEGLGGIARLPSLAAAASAAPAGLASPSAGLIAALSGPSLFAGRVLTVLCGCYAQLRIVRRMVGSNFGGLAAAALLIGLTWLVAGPALVSGAPTIGGAFSPTQAAIAVLTLALALLLDGLSAAGIALLGIVFVLQPEVALWGVLVLAGASAGLAIDGTRVGRAWLAGSACACLVAVPVAVWWTHAGGFLPTSAPLGGLLPLPPWLPWSVPLANWVLSVCMLATGLAAFSALGPDGRAASGAFLGGALVFVCGCVAPLLSRSPWLLALRPIAADAVLQPLAIVAVSAVLARDLGRNGGMLRVVLSVIAAAGLLLHPYLLPLATLAMLARAAAAHGELLGIERRIRDRNRVFLSRIALGAVVLAAVAGGILQNL